MKLNGIFKDDMVFQRDRQIRVFGTSGEAVKVCLKSEGAVIAEGVDSEYNDDGSFVICLDKLPAGGPYVLEVSSGEQTITLNRVYIGEVWLAGGQSNMEYPLGRSADARHEVESCPDTRIHFYQVPVADTFDDEAQANEDKSSWSMIKSSTCYGMSGVAYYFARKVSEYLEELGGEGEDLHIGVVGCYLGGTSVSSWQSCASLKSTGEGQRYLEDYRLECAKWASDEEYQSAEDKFFKETMEYVARVDKVLADDPYLTYLQAEQLVAQGGPWPPPVGPRSQRRPGALFEAMIRRIVPYAFRGVIFYQGEEDTGKYSDIYAVVFRTMIEEWRRIFRDSQLPFLYCQLPVYPEPGSMELVNWEEVQRQQELAAREIPHIYMTDIMDCGEINNVHPSDKKTPGSRLAESALRNVYEVRRDY